MSQIHIYTVNEVTNYIKREIEKNEKLQDIWVRGEISNLKLPSRHLYFSLKDEDSLLSCVMFQNRTVNLNFTLKNGLEVITKGSIGIYKPQGRYQLYVEEVLPAGKGALYLKFEQLKEELKERGYFDLEHKIPLPYLPQRIGVATSPKGAAIKDILAVIDKRFHNVEIILSPCRVQGNEAAAEIARAVQNLNDYGKVDVIIVGRGGGSFEDLFCFNEKIVAEAIYNSHIPIISAVGHEIDISISDFVADERAATPSAAAERVIPKKEDLIEMLQTRVQRMSILMKNYINLSSSMIEKAKASYIFKHPYRRSQEIQQQVDELEKKMIFSFSSRIKLDKNQFISIKNRLLQASPQKRIDLIKENIEREIKKLYTSSKRRLKKEKERISFYKKRMDDLSPLSILKRGYSICFTHPEGKIIKEYSEVKKGERIKVKLHQGKIYSQIYQVEEGK